MVIEIKRVPDRPRTDPREYQTWFKRLDEDAQDVVRQRWLDDQLEWERVGLGARRYLHKDLLRGALLVGGVHAGVIVLLASVTGGTPLLNVFLHVLVAALVGVGLGGFWSAVQAGVLACAISASVTQAMFELMLGMHPIFALCAGMAAGLSGKVLGLKRTELPGS